MNPHKIGRYQLENLLKNRIGFTYLDLCDSREVQGPLLTGAVAVPPAEALNFVRGLNLPNHAPIVLICENGAKSLGVARELEENSYLNVFVVEGGMGAIGP